MRHDTSDRPPAGAGRAMWYAAPIAAFLAIEFLDELVFGTSETAWPLVRDDLHLSYLEIGLLLTVPAVVGNVVEALVGVLADVWNRRALVLGGGVAFAAALALAGASPGFAALLAAFALLNPASGSFVSLSQATLMDAAPEDRERNMARWALAGSAANASAPLFVAALAALGASWRALFVALAAVSAGLVAAVWRVPFPTPPATAAEGEDEDGAAPSLAGGLRAAARAARRPVVWRWLALLECSDLMLDTLHGFLALYFVDVAGATPAHAALAVAVWTVVGLAGDALLIPLLARVDGIRYLRASAAALLALYPAFLVVSHPAAKLALLGAVGFFNAGWYSILKARLYAEMPGMSGTVLAVHNLAHLAGCLVPLGLGALAEAAGLDRVMWLLLAGPLALLAGLPRRVGATGRPR